MGTVHLPCPYCTSSDAYVEYADGGAKCFSCGKYIPANKYKALGQSPKATIGASVCPQLPEDAKGLLKAPYTAITQAAYIWVHKYGITDAEIDEHNFCISEKERLLIFPVYGNSLRDLIMWQAKTFKPGMPKYITRGKPEEVLHIIGADKGRCITLVEDLISAIKIGRQAPAAPLWGSHVSQTQAMRLSRLYDSANLYLDYDKKDSSIKQCMKNSCIIKMKPIVTALDPKEYSDEQIKSALCGSV
jgi:hypothetical protein